MNDSITLESLTEMPQQCGMGKMPTQEKKQIFKELDSLKTLSFSSIITKKVEDATIQKL